jgi:NDP-sugar pyrophosphorylase family protein
VKAIILAAGKGERLKSITKSVPKPMIEINGRPVLEHNIEWLKSYGLKDIYINLHHLPHIIQNYFGNGSKFGVKITYSYEPNLLGTAGAVRKIADEYWNTVNRKSSIVNSENNNTIHNLRCTIHEPFFVFYGDNLFEYNLKEIIDFHNGKKGIGTIAVYEKDDVSQSGIVVLDNNNKIQKFIEKPKPEEIVSHLVNTGIYVLEQNILNYISPDKMLDFGRDIFPEMIRANESLFSIIVKGRLTAIDTPELLNAVNRKT